MASPLLKPVPCDICDNAAAKFHCNTCGDALCPTCKSHHLKSRGTRNHDIVPYAQKLSPKYLAGLFCHTHKANTPDYWCDTCGVPICGPCITKEHKGHQFSNITAVLSERRDALLEETKTLRDKTVGEWEEVLEEAKKITADYTGTIDMIDKELADRAKAMHAQVDAILSQSKKTLQQIKAGNLTKLQDQEKYISDRLQQLKEDVAKYEDQLKYADPNALLQYKQGTVLSKDETKPPSLEKAPIPVFAKGQNDVDSMEKMFGQLSIQDLGKKKKAEISSSSSSTQKSRSDRKDGQRSLIPKPSVQCQLDVDTCHPRIACVDRSRAWVVTREETLQLMNRDGQATDTINIDPYIRDMTMTSNGDILLVDSTDNIKSVCTQKKKISTLFRTSGKSWGLCCLPNNDIVVTISSDHQVIVYSRDGKVRRTLDNIKFRYPYKVAVNKVNQDICICDHDSDAWYSEGKLINVGADGQLRYEYTGQGGNKFCPVGVCTDQMGHVLVTDYKNHRVHILDQDGQFIQYVLTTEQGLHQPNTLDVDRECHVWVGEYDQHVKIARYLE